MSDERTEGYSGVIRGPFVHFGTPPEVQYTEPEKEEPEVYEFEKHVSVTAARIALVADRILGVFRRG